MTKTKLVEAAANHEAELHQYQQQIRKRIDDELEREREQHKKVLNTKEGCWNELLLAVKSDCEEQQAEIEQLRNENQKLQKQSKIKMKLETGANDTNYVEVPM